MPPDLLLPLSPRVARPIVRVISLIYRHHLYYRHCMSKLIVRALGTESLPVDIVISSQS